MEISPYRNRLVRGALAFSVVTTLAVGLPGAAVASGAEMPVATARAAGVNADEPGSGLEDRVRAAREVGLVPDEVLLGYTDCNFVIAVWNHVKETPARFEVRIAAEQAFTGSDADCTAFIVTDISAAVRRDTERNLREEEERRSRNTARRAAAAAMGVIADEALLLGTDRDFAFAIYQRASLPDWAKVNAAALVAFGGTPEQQRQFIDTGLAEAAAADKVDRIERDQETSDQEKARLIARAAKQFAAERVGVPVTDALLNMPDEDFIREIWNGTEEGTEVQAAAIRALRSSDPAAWSAFINTGVHEAKRRDIANELAAVAREQRTQAAGVLSRAEATGHRNLALAARNALAGSDDDVADFLRIGQGQVRPDLPNVVQAASGHLCLNVDSGVHAVRDLCRETRGQGWKIMPRSGGHLELTNNRSGKCLAISGGSVAAGARAIHWQCNAGPEQQWIPEASSTTFTRLRNKKSNMCLAVDGAAVVPPTAPAPVIQLPCNSGTDQGWQIRARGLVNLEPGSFNDDRHQDLLAVDMPSGKLYLYPGTSGRAFGARVPISDNWNGMDKLTAGDFNRDGRDDLIAVERATSKRYLYPGNGTPGLFGARVEIGTGWNGYRELTAGQFNRDASTDLITVQTSTGKLLLYAGTGADGRAIPAAEIGTGWNGYSELTAGDFNRDSYTDLIAVQNATGKLMLYAGTAAGGRFGAATEIGLGWNGYSELTTGEFNGDAYEDLMTTENATGRLLLYAGTPAGGSFAAGIDIGIGG